MKHIKNIINEEINNYIINEARYIDTNPKYKKNPYQSLEQEPFKENEYIKVFHGTDTRTALFIALNGTSGQEFHPRRFSYENGMNPLGLFVTTDFNKATDFSRGHGDNNHVILELTVNYNDLETPVWNGQNSYFGQGSNPIPFSSEDERNKQKQQYVKNAKEHEYEYIRKSYKPEVANMIFDNPEHQALFMGNISPNQIKRFWVSFKDGKYQPMKLNEFIRKFKNITRSDVYGREEKITKEKAYLPNENFTTYRDFAERMAKIDNDYNEETINMYEEGIIDYMKNDPSILLSIVQQYMFPKQIKQMMGEKYYKENFNNFFK